MVTLEALTRDYPQMENYRWAYAANWHDGPIKGMIETHLNTYLWAKLVDEVSEVDKVVRTYSLMDLDYESASYEAEKHFYFERFVGSHWSFTNGQRGVVKPQSEWHKYYDKYDWKSPRPLTGRIVGWIKE